MKILIIEDDLNLIDIYQSLFMSIFDSLDIEYICNYDDYTNANLSNYDYIIADNYINNKSICADVINKINNSTILFITTGDYMCKDLIENYDNIYFLQKPFTIDSIINIINKSKGQ